MDWRDEGFIISTRRHGESAAIVEVFTAHHGRHAGVVRGGAGRRMAPLLQPGSQVGLEWSARLEDHLGHYRVEPMRSHAAAIMADRAALAALCAVTALIAAALPERETYPALYAHSLALLEALGMAPDWPARYPLWELALLAEIGFGLDLARCAVTGGRDDLVYVSPKSGRAVSRDAGAAWADKLLPLPAFLRDGAVSATPGDLAASPAPSDLAAALRLTGFFLAARLAPNLPRQTLPPARDRAAEAILRAARAK